MLHKVSVAKVRPQPFIRQQQAYQRFRYSAKRDHDRKDNIASHSHILKNMPFNAFGIVLQRHCIGIHAARTITPLSSSSRESNNVKAYGYRYPSSAAENFSGSPTYKDLMYKVCNNEDSNNFWRAKRQQRLQRRRNSLPASSLRKPDKRRHARNYSARTNNVAP